MKQYQAVILRLTGRTADDEELVTDLLNERSRTGWEWVSSTPLSPRKLLLVFARSA